MKPFFSIVIPTLNEEKFLPRLLNDLVKQKEKNFEVIVVDGKSEDNTRKIVKEYSIKLKIKLFQSNKRNVCYQRNLGAKKGRGEYLIFMDADTKLFKNYLSTIKKTIEKNSYFFLTTYQLPDNNNRIDIFLSQMANYGLEILKIVNKQMAPGYNFIIHKDIFLKIGGFNEKATFSEEHELSMRLLKSGIKLSIIPKKLLYWSHRRLEKDGRLPIMIKYAFAAIYSILFGQITDKNFAYKMGGDYFLDKNWKKDKKIEIEFKKYLKKIKKTFRKFLFD